MPYLFFRTSLQKNFLLFWFLLLQFVFFFQFRIFLIFLGASFDSLFLSARFSEFQLFPELVIPIFLFLDDSFYFPCDLLMEYFDKHSIYNGLIGSLVFLIFSFCLESNTYFIKASSHSYHSFILACYPILFVFLYQKFKTQVPPLTEKNNMDHIVCETAKVNITSEQIIY